MLRCYRYSTTIATDGTELRRVPASKRNFNEILARAPAHASEILVVDALSRAGSKFGVTVFYDIFQTNLAKHDQKQNSV